MTAQVDGAETEVERDRLGLNIKNWSFLTSFLSGRDGHRSILEYRILDIVGSKFSATFSVRWLFGTKSIGEFLVYLPETAMTNHLFDQYSRITSARPAHGSMVTNSFSGL